MGGLWVVFLGSVAVGLVVLVAMSIFGLRQAATRRRVIALSVLAGLAVAIGLNSEILRTLGSLDLPVLLVATVPNVLLWRRLARFPGGRAPAIAFAVTYVLAVAWNMGVGEKVGEWRDARAYQVGRAEQAEKVLAPTYVQRYAANLLSCRADPGICWGLGESYRSDGPERAEPFFGVCCEAGNDRCCGMQSAMIEEAQR